MKTSNSFIPAKKFSHVNRSTTYGELKSLLPSTGTGRVPGINKLRDTAVIVLRAKTESGIVEVYDNGFYTYTENEHYSSKVASANAILSLLGPTEENAGLQPEEVHTDVPVAV